MKDKNGKPIYYCVVCGHYVAGESCDGCGNTMPPTARKGGAMKATEQNGDNVPWDGWNLDEPIRNLITLEFMQKLIRMRDSEDLSEELRGTSDRLLDLIMLDFHGESWKQYSDDEKVAEIEKKQLDLFGSHVVS